MLTDLFDARVVGPTLAALLTGGALLLQAHLQRREQRNERRQTRSDDEERRKEQRKHSLADHWRTARHEAHVRVLAAAAQRIAIAQKTMLAAYDHRAGIGPDPSSTPGTRHTLNQWREQLDALESYRQAEADAELLAGDATRAHLAALQKAFREHDYALALLQELILRQSVDLDEQIETQQERETDLLRELQTYRQAIRLELGTHMAD